MHVDRSRLVCEFGLFFIAVIGLFANGIACAQIDLELRPAFQSITVGESVELGLYAVSTDSQTLSAADVVLLWPPDLLQLDGNSNVGAVPLLASTIPAVDQYGLNVSLADGDALYVAFAMLGTPVVATPAGTLLTTFEFTAVAEGVAEVLIPEMYINDSETVVLDGMVPNLDVTGELFGATVTILPACKADVVVNGEVDVFDLLAVLKAWGACAGECPADVTNDTMVDVFDLLAVLEAWGPCPGRT